MSNIAPLKRQSTEKISVKIAPPPVATPEPIVEEVIEEQTEVVETAPAEVNPVVIKLIELVKDEVKELLETKGQQPVVILLQLLTQIMGIIEYVQVNNVILDGKTKREIVLDCGRMLITTAVATNPELALLLPIYNELAPVVLESVVAASKKINVTNVLVPCCLPFFRK